MSKSKKGLFLVNLVGGFAVLGSYALGVIENADLASQLWGGIPLWLRPVYTISMFLAAISYLLFFYHIVFRMDPTKVRLPWNPRRGFYLFFGLILVPSTFWMPLTLAWLQAPSPGLWLVIRLVLFLVALGSLLTLVALAMQKHRAPSQFW